jgi:hypothetical protein
MLITSKNRIRLNFLVLSGIKVVDRISVRHEISRHFRKRREHVKAKINEYEGNSKGESIMHMCRGVNKIKTV